MVLLQPAQLFAMRAIGQHAHHIAPLRPKHECVNAIEEVVGAGELAGRLCRRMHHHARHRLHRSAAACLHLQITAAAVRELGHPRLGPLAGERVGPIAAAAARRVVDFPRRLDQFRGRDLDRQPRRSANRDPRHDRGVLAEIVDPHARLHLLYVDWSEDLKSPDRRRGKGNAFQLTAGPFDDYRRRPLWLPAGIVVFAAEHTGKGDRPRTYLPAIVGANDLRRAVGMFEVQLRDRLQGAERAGELGVASARDIVHAVAQQQADRIGVFVQECRHVVGVVQAGLVVLGPARCEQIVAGLAAVERQFILSEAADEGGGAAQFRLCGEIAAEDQACRRGRRGDPLRLPVVQPRGERCRPAPFGRLASGVPHTDFPIVARAGCQRLAGVGDVNRLVGRHPAGIPRALDDELVGRLPARVQDPA